MRTGMSSRAVLWAGFGSLLVLMILVAVNANRALDRIEASSGQIRRGFLRRDELLNRLRANLYRSSIDLRDYLLHADPQLADRRRVEIQHTGQEIAADLHEYRQGAPPSEIAAVDELQRDVDIYFGLVKPVLNLGRGHAPNARLRLFAHLPDFSAPAAITADLREHPRNGHAATRFRRNHGRRRVHQFPA